MIYFLRRANGDIKIGTTEKYHQRLSSLIREHGDLELLGLMDGGYEVEQSLHQQFATERVKPRTEWFQPSETLRSYISHHAHLSLPERETGMTTVKIEKDLAQKIYTIATAMGLAANDIVRMAMEAKFADEMAKVDAIRAGNEPPKGE